MIGLILLVVAAASGERCGRPAVCDCSSPILHEITCRGANIAGFPVFDSFLTPSILSIRMINTSITKLPLFLKKTWPNLIEIHLLGNEALSCKAMDNLYRGGLHIYSECEPRLPNITITSAPANPDIAGPVVGGLALVFTLGSILGIFLRDFRRYRGQYSPAIQENHRARVTSV